LASVALLRRCCLAEHTRVQLDNVCLNHVRLVADSHFHPEFICEVTQISNRIALALFGRLGHEEVRSF
jgi:hypothetical protein